MRWTSRIAGIALALALASAGRGASPVPRALRPAIEAISAEALLRHIQVLSADEFEGRAPGTAGEERTVRYLIEQFQTAGLGPGNPDGTYVQDVPLVGAQAQVNAGYSVGDARTEWRFPDECVLWTKRQVPDVAVKDSEMVFVGYGVVAPEYGWDDYKGLDVRGQTLVMLINDPQVADRDEPGKLDPRYFKGRAMTYYGRWTYKFEIAAERGAAAALIVHETGPAGYPWEVVSGSNARENFDLRAADGNAGRAAVEGWITLERARKLCAASGFDYETLKKAAARTDFKPVPLKTKADFHLRNTLREVRSRNVVARLGGARGRRSEEVIVYSAHWDHLGRDPRLAGDQVFHGALDNASGVAALLELGRAFRRLKTAPKRSVLFLAVTGEEKGLLGAKYYAGHPLDPLERTLANINMDVLNPWGRTRDLEVIGFGNSSLEDVLTAAAAAQGRTVAADSEPERGRFYRSDHFEFAKVGVPALYCKAGINYLGQPKEFGLRKLEEYVQRDYHKVTDVIKPDWDLAGAVEDARLLLQVGWTVAQANRWPEWKPESEFRARREQMLKGRKN